MENDKDFTPEDSLKLISQVITDTRRNFHHIGFFLLLWGWVSVIILIVNFFVLRYPHLLEQRNLSVWTVWFPIAFAFAVSFLYLRRKNQTKRVKNQLTRIIRALWLVTFLVLLLNIVIAKKTGTNPASVTLTIIGLSVFMTGYIIKFLPLMLGATLFGISSIVTMSMPGDYQLLVESLAITLGYLVPGYMLKYSKK
ncbi:MAG TPA: hypothetical protein VIH57_23940 [Bacteroidales bacterium]